MLQQIVELRKAGYRSIKAGHEADGQLGYMARKRLADFVMSEDGDIIVHGAPRVLTKVRCDGRRLTATSDGH